MIYLKMSGLTQRKRGGAAESQLPNSPGSEGVGEDEYQKSFYSNPSANNSSSQQQPGQGNSNDNLLFDFKADEDGFTDQDLEGKKVKLTLMEEVLLLGLRDQQVHTHIYLSRF